jgi:hypothetical protein
MGELVFLHAIGAEEACSLLQSFGTDICHHAAHTSGVKKQFSGEAVDSHIFDFDPR